MELGEKKPKKLEQIGVESLGLFFEIAAKVLMSQLVWSPVYKILEDRIQSSDDVILILVPFAKLAAFQKLHWFNSKKDKIKVVCRWRPEDIVAGVSDLEIYPFLKQSDCELYINSNLIF